VLKPIAKGQTKGEIGVTVQPATPLGPAPFAFKGFVQRITLPQTTPPVGCGSGWTTFDDATPPSVVPAYMGVIVTSSVTRGDTSVSGNTVKIVVVKTNPGYGPKPTKPGTGTIVANYC